MSETSTLIPVEDMTCRQAAELLPWLLNGSLEADEKRALKNHLADCESCRSELEATREAWGIFTRHVPSLALVEYARGREPHDVDVATIENHLKSCASCRQEVEWASADRILPFRSPNRQVAERVRTWGGLAAAAGLAAVLAAGFLIDGFDRTSPTGTTSAELAAPTAAASDGTVFADTVFTDTAFADAVFTDAVFTDGFESGTTGTWSRSSQ